MAEGGELVRVYINLDNDSAIAPERDAFSVALSPFLECWGDLVFQEMPEGFKIMRTKSVLSRQKRLSIK